MEGAEMMKQAKNIWAMLDNMAEDDPQSYRKFIDKNIQEGKEYMEWKNTPPESHMCVQTKLTGESPRTLYMNFCSWIRIPEPKSDEDPIPVFSSDIIKVNANVSAVNVAFAASILNQYGRDATNMAEQEALVHLAMNYVQDVHKVRIQRSYSILPNSKPFYGEWNSIVTSLRRKIDKNQNENSMEDMLNSMKEFAPVTANLNQETIVSEINKMKNGEIETVDTSKIVLPGDNKTDKKDKKVLIEEIRSEVTEGETGDGLKEPGYTMRCVSAEAENARRLVLCVRLDGVKSVAECELDLTENEVTLRVESRYHLNLRLPEPVQDELARAKFSKKTSILTVTLPTKTR